MVCVSLNYSSPRISPALVLERHRLKIRGVMNKAHTEMNGNPQQIRECSHLVSPPDWIVSGCRYSFELFVVLAQTCERRESAVPLPPDQLSLILLRWNSFILFHAALEKFSAVGSLKMLGHMLPYFPVLTASINILRSYNISDRIKENWITDQRLLNDFCLVAQILTQMYLNIPSDV